MNELTFVASVYKVQTLADGGIRLTLDMPETAIPQMAMLAACQRDGIVLRFEANEAENGKISGKYSHYKKDGKIN